MLVDSLGNSTSLFWTVFTIGRGEALRGDNLTLFHRRMMISSRTRVHNIQSFRLVADNKILSSAGCGTTPRNLVT